jgi:TonB family protein
MRLKPFAFLLIMALTSSNCWAQGRISVRFLDEETGQPIQNVTVSGNDGSSDVNGYLQVSANAIDTIELSAPDYPVKKVAVNRQNELTVRLNKRSEEVQAYVMVDETAQFPGGMPKYYEYVGINLRYPAEARERRIEGKVFVEFVIGTDGLIDQNSVRVINKAEPTLAAEAVRIVRNSPPWIPGKKDGQTVRQKLVLPYTFKLSR